MLICNRLNYLGCIIQKNEAKYNGAISRVQIGVYSKVQIMKILILILFNNIRATQRLRELSVISMRKFKCA